MRRDFFRSIYICTYTFEKITCQRDIPDCHPWERHGGRLRWRPGCNGNKVRRSLCIYVSTHAKRAPQKRPVKETYKETNMWTYLIAIHENGTTVAGVGDHDVTACNGHDHACWPIQPPLVHYLCVCEREAEKERERERGRERERARARKGGGGRDDSVCVREWVCEWNICKYVYV